MSKFRTLIAAALVLGGIGSAQAHHSYAMFDASKRQTVTGTVAKLEWTNPHVFLWVYVRSASNPGKYDTYAFENGSPNAASRIGWSRSVLSAGDTVTIEYSPLRDGRRGGHLVTATLPDGRTLRAAGGPPPPPRR